MILFKAIVLLTCLVLTTDAVHLFSSVDDGDNLDALCKGNNINLTKRSHLVELVRKLQEGGRSECPDNIANALETLMQVIKGNDGIECSMDAAKNYKNFYKNHLDRSDKTKNNARDKLPKSFIDFAIAYGVQISSLCRVNMVEQLLDQGIDAVTAADFKAVMEMIGPNGMITAFLGDTQKKPDDFLLSADFDSIDGEKAKSTPKIGFNYETSAVIKRVRRRCELRFKPVYEPLMIPVNILANLGLRHRSKKLKMIIKDASKDGVTRDVLDHWAKVAFMCDVYSQIELIELHEDEIKSDGTDSTRVIVTKQDEDAGTNKKVQGKYLLDRVKEVDDENLVPVYFKPNLSVNITDEILPENLIRAVRKVDTSRSEIANRKHRFRVIIMSRILHHLTHGLADPHAREAFDKLIRSARAQNRGEDVNVRTQLVSSMDGLISQRLNPDKPIKAVHYLIPIGTIVHLTWVGIILLLLFGVFGLWLAGQTGNFGE